jgi:hypothetical protein
MSLITSPAKTVSIIVAPPDTAVGKTMSGNEAVGKVPML